MTDEDAVVKRIIARHGETINLRESPDVIIDIIRSFRFQLDDPDGGSLPGGVPPTPPAPGPAAAIGPTNADLLREVLKLSKQVATLQKRLGP
jgi:hypothetical protein